MRKAIIDLIHKGLYGVVSGRDITIVEHDTRKLVTRFKITHRPTCRRWDADEDITGILGQPLFVRNQRNLMRLLGTALVVTRKRYPAYQETGS